MRSFENCLLYLGLLSSTGILALSVGPASSDRRAFLGQATAAVVGTTFGVGMSEAFIQNADAVNLYQPLPGSLAGQVHVITGASSGLGLESAKRLAVAGATVVMTTRSEAKGEKAKNQVHQYLQERSVTNQEIYAIPLDLNDFASVKSFPDQYKQTLGSRTIDVLMNNAGVKNSNLETTIDGYEQTFQSNHLGPFLLTTLLFPYLNRSGSRIINVASSAHNLAKTIKTGKQGLDMNNLNGELLYNDWGAYGNTKLENILFTQEIQRRADAAGLTWLTAVSLHPGVVGTDFWRNSYVAKSSPAFSLQALASTLFFDNILTTEEGANTQIMLAAENVVAKGKYYDEFGKMPELAPFAQDSVKARELWDVSEKFAGSKFSID